MVDKIESPIPAAENATKLVTVYVKMRDDLAAQQKTFDEFKKKRKAEMQIIADQLQKIMDGSDIESLKTSAGTAFKATKDFVSVEDWNATLTSIVMQIFNTAKFDGDHTSIDDVVQDVLDSGAFAIFNKSANKTAVKQYMEEHAGSTPPGIGYGTQIEIQVRRPAK